MLCGVANQHNYNLLGIEMLMTMPMKVASCDFYEKNSYETDVLYSNLKKSMKVSYPLKIL